ncbi:bifunctional diguanylate cyclase/phosphodiesterase [Ahrensia sp. R2A130]|uniref:putative bifunctional diguanylate cyclase/phosphodiesterase n=1 Tax=Ahrensia sp. R2A130 TaxID=744979 RepID=UPI001FFF4ABD|nr:GGDEF domain-containing phosphodiesterase [Ahrensia sp. R2A130]
MVGVPATALAVMLTAYAAKSPALYAVAAMMFVIGLGRYIMGKRFEAAQEKLGRNTWAYRRWELHHTLLATFYALMFGAWCAVATYTGNQFALFTAFTVTFANLIGVSGRAFPIKRLVNGQAIAASVPLIACLVWIGGMYAWLAILLTPYLISVMLLAQRQRGNLLENVIQRQTAQALASRIHTALENIPQGMCMFDADGTTQVVNEQIARFVGMSQDDLLGKPLPELALRFQSAFNLDRETFDRYDQWMASGERSSFSATFTLERKGTCTVRFKSVRLENGGIVITMDDVTDEVRAARQIDYMKRFDTLTGLMNRNEVPNHITAELNHAIAGQQVAVMVFNIDRFKELNDLHGMRIGDDLVCAFAEKLEQIVGPRGNCARFGGDEFVVVLRAPRCADLARHVADLVSEATDMPWIVGPTKQKLDVGTSIGIAVSDEENHRKPSYCDALLTEAAVAMAVARRSASSNWQIFNQQMRQDMEQQHKLQEDLRSALDNGELEPFFQPLVSTVTGQVTTCEALLRWRRANGDLVPPGIFIPVAEEMGLISSIGDFIIHESCKICATWPDNIRVAVNLSPLQFHNGKLLRVVDEALIKSGLAADRLELEITESLMLNDVEATISVLQSLKDRGVRISLDDFGTGYSSLSYMNQLPLDKVKIDRSFVVNLQTDERSVSMVQAVTSLSQKLGLKVVVEGIETDEQLALLLAKAPVDEIQGYHFSRPQDASAVARQLVSGSADRAEMMRMMRTAKSNSKLIAA